MKIIAILVALFCCTSVEASVLDYLRGYHLGFDYANTNDRVRLQYDTDRTGAPPSGCSQTDPEKQTCSVTMSGGSSSGWGIFLQQPFKRQGDFHFTYDIGFGVRMLSGSSNDNHRSDAEAAGLPFRKAEFNLLAVVAKPYIQIGFTPTKYPELLLSLGPAAQIAVGNATINDSTKNVALATASSGLVSGFIELEIVFWRFGGGALSIFGSSDVTSGEDGTRLYPDSVDDMENIRANFNRSVNGGFLFGMGLKILLDWP